MKRILDWFEHRLKLRETILPMMTHPVPKGVGWAYVFGSATLTLFLIQIVTGIFLAMVYVPSADHAYNSLEYLSDPAKQPLGWFLRAVHYYSGSGMIIMVFIHMAQVFLWGAYKYPRELTWLVGVVLLLLTLGLMFSGQVLRWDQDAYWGIAVGGSMAGRVPYLGPYIVDLLLGGPIIGSATLSRFFALHVFILPGLLIMFLAVHLHLVLHKGVSEPPVPGKPVDPKTYDAEYAKELATGEPFFPNAMYKDGLFSCLVILIVVGVACVFGPKELSLPPDPTLLNGNPRPDWPFLSAFALMSLCPPQFETFAILALPVLGIGILVAVPFVAGSGERSFKRRPVAVMTVAVTAITYIVLTYIGHVAPWSPKMDAWSGDPIASHLLEERTPTELQGAVVFQYKSCRNCHALAGVGGQRGPDLTFVASRLTRDELVRQVVQGTMGGGNMPAYGKELKPAELEALVSYLKTLRRPGQEAHSTGDFAR